MSAAGTVSELHAAARELAAEGVAVVPLHTVKDGKCSCNRDCPKPGKHPRTLHGKDDATTDPEAIDTWWVRWPDSNVGINTELSGLVVPDVDPRHGGAETFAALEREHGPLPEDAPRARTGGGGEHIYLSANGQRVKTGASAIGPGVDLTYLIVAPPSVHESGARYEWLVPFGKRVPAPAWVLEPAGGRANGQRPTEPVADRIPYGQQHNELVRRAGSMRRWGASAAEIDAALQVMNKERLERPGDPAEITRIAESMMRYKPVDREVWAASQTGEMPAGARPRFTLRNLDLARMRNPVWSFELLLREGVLNALCGVGGIGKTTLVGWAASRLSLGELPGAYHGTPVTTLVIGNEDDADEDWTPRIHAAGGDVSRVKVLEYTDGVPLDFARDTDRLRGLIRTCGAKLVYFDQVLDNRPRGSNANLQHDVRDALQPLHQVARDTRVTVLYSLHPTKSREQGSSLRDRAGGSGQWTDMPRNGLLLGWHPERSGVRVLARGKGNRGKTPPALTFTIEEFIVPNPNTGEAIETSILTGLEEEEGLTAEDVRAEPPKPDPGPTKEQIAHTVLAELGDDGEWHSRKEAAVACANADAGGRAFERAFESLEKKTKREGREVHWRLE